jgi:hypothetical protein
MRNLFYYLVVGIFCLTTISSCHTYKTVSIGLENEAFLDFIGTPKKYKGGVDVSIDEKVNFKAIVNKERKDLLKGTVYSISTGTHTIKVSYNNQVLISKQLFISSQETKKLILP